MSYMEYTCHPPQEPVFLLTPFCFSIQPTNQEENIDINPIAQQHAIHLIELWYLRLWKGALKHKQEQQGRYHSLATFIQSKIDYILYLYDLYIIKGW